VALALLSREAIFFALHPGASSRYRSRQEGVVEFVRRKIRVVLLVDDSPNDLKAWKRDISLRISSTIRVLSALDRPTALSMAEAEKPDLAVIDQHLHDGLGTDLLPALRGCAPEMLMILTSSDPTYEDARCAGSNALLVLPKPRSWAPYFSAIESGGDLRLIPLQPETLPLAAIEASHISRVLRSHGNNISVTAQVLGMDRSGLQRKLEKLGIRIDRSRPSQLDDDAAV
jgi:ActR/RegA family two-component response regulator